jgi:hypothetical protein
VGAGPVPPLLAAARLMAARGHEVRVLGSAVTRRAAVLDYPATGRVGQDSAEVSGRHSPDSS